MARGYNNVQLVGTLTQKPEMRYTGSGLAILELNLAGSDRVVGDDGQMRDLAWYHRASVFGKQAEYMAEQLEAGTPVLVEGRLNYHSWDDQATGQRRSRLDVNANRVEALTLGPRKGEATLTDARGQSRLTNALNQVTIIGNLTRDADLRYTPSGQAVCRISVAVNEQFRDRTGQDQERVAFVDVNAWRELAEAISELSKGDGVFVIGRLTNENWTDNEGNQRYSTRLEAQRIEYLTRGPGGGGTSARPPQTDAQRDQPERQESRPKLDIDEEFPPEEDLPF